MTAPRRLSPQVQFLLLAVLVNLAASAIARGHSSQIVAFAAALDMTITVTALYYWLVVRPGLRPKASLIFVALLGLLRASYAFPQVVPGKALIAGAVELGLLVAVLVGRKTFLADLIPSQTAARALTAELSILYYAFAWRAKPDVPAGSHAFTLHRKSGFNDLILFVGLASLLEVVPVHLVVSHWSHTAAWILTGLSLYGALWAMALSRSFELLPTLITPDALIVRFGLLFSIRIPFEELLQLSHGPVPEAVPVPRNSTPTVFLEFRRPLTAEKIFGFTKQVTNIGLCPDDPEAFEEALLRAVPNINHLA